MLEMKYYKTFKGSDDILLVIGNKDAYRVAASYLGAASGCFLPASGLIDIKELGNIDRNMLSLSKKECLSFADICQILLNNERPSHDYLTIHSLPDIELLISIGEYESLP